MKKKLSILLVVAMILSLIPTSAFAANPNNGQTANKAFDIVVGGNVANSEVLVNLTNAQFTQLVNGTVADTGIKNYVGLAYWDGSKVVALAKDAKFPASVMNSGVAFKVKCYEATDTIEEVIYGGVIQAKQVVNKVERLVTVLGKADLTVADLTAADIDAIAIAASTEKVIVSDAANKANNCKGKTAIVYTDLLNNAAYDYAAKYPAPVISGLYATFGIVPNSNNQTIKVTLPIKDTKLSLPIGLNVNVIGNNGTKAQATVIPSATSKATAATVDIATIGNVAGSKEVIVQYTKAAEKLTADKIVTLDAISFRESRAINGDVPTDKVIFEAGDYLELILNKGFEFVNGAATAQNGIAAAIDADTPNILKVTVGATVTPGIADIVLLQNVKIKATTEAAAGDAVITIKAVGFDSDVVFSTREMKVATYADYGIKVSTNGDLSKTVIPAGWVGTTTTDSRLKTMTLIIEESVANSYLDTRKSLITLPDEVKVINAVFNPTISSNVYANAPTFEENVITLPAGDYAINEAQPFKYAVDIYVSAEVNFTGDITAEVTGAAMAGCDAEVVIGTVETPIDVTFDTAKVAIGYKNLEIGTVVISEAKAGNLTKAGNLILGLEDGAFDTFNSNVKVEITEGDMLIKQANVRLTTSGLIIPITSASEKASEITITGIALKIDRTLPEGKYALQVTGEAFLTNNIIATKTNGGWGTASALTYGSFFEIVTPGEDTTDANTQVGTGDVATVVEKKVNINEVKDGYKVAFIDANSRTLIALRSFESLIGATVGWDASTQTASVTKGSTTVQATIGSNQLVTYINGVKTNVATMDTVAVISAERSYVPFRAIVEALGYSVDVTYSGTGTTQSITIK